MACSMWRTQAMLVAIIDIGTNTFNLLVCQRENELHVIHGEEVAVFLGRGGIERGILTDDAMERGILSLIHISKPTRPY